MSALNENTGKQYRQYTPSFAEYWDELVGWETRAASEGGFYERLLKEAGVREVADVACGTGFNAVHLAKAGLVVTATDGSDNMLEKTLENAAKHGATLAHTQVADWLTLDQALGENRFDALVCLGNSFTHLFDEKDRRKAMENFVKVVRPGGVVIVDHRNYDAMLEHGFDSSHSHNYTGKGVQAYPAELHDELARFEYVFEDGAKFQLNMFPIRRSHLTEVMEDAGLVNVQWYGDYQRPFDKDKADFIQQVAYKPIS